MEKMKAIATLPDLATRDVRSILIVRLKALGDIVLSFPIVHALRDRFPEARIRYLCWGRYAEALSGVEGLDEVVILPERFLEQAALAFSLRRERIECVIDLLSSPRSALVTFVTGAPIRIGMDTGARNWCYNFLLPRAVMREGARIKCYTLESNDEIIRLLGLKQSGARRLDIGFPASENEKPWAREYVARLGAGRKRIVGIVPGSVYQAKSWPESFFAELATLARERLGAVSVILWGPGEELLARRIVAGAACAVLGPPMGIARLGALISMLDCLVGVDSGPKHLAVIQGVPTVTLFGPTDPCIWDPISQKHRVVKLDVDCFPCKKKTCVPNRCLSGISPGMVLKEVADVLGGRCDASPDTGRGERA